MTRALVALVALALAFPAATLAQAPQTNAPPGNSAIDEYLETVPGATGDSRPQPRGQSSDGGGLTPAERARLEQLGPDGRVLADAVDAAPAKPGAAQEKLKTGDGSAATGGDGRSPLGEVAGAFAGSDGGGGMGIVLPGILIAALLAAVAAMLLRRRAAS